MYKRKFGLLLFLLFAFFINCNVANAEWQMICEYNFQINLNTWSVSDMVADDWWKVWEYNSGITTKVHDTHVYVYVGETLTSDKQIKYKVAFSDKCNSEGCSEKSFSANGNAIMTGNTNNVHATGSFIDDLEGKGKCPTYAYIDMLNIKENTIGYNEVCFDDNADSGLCSSLTETAYDNNNTGFNVSMKTQPKLTNHLDSKISPTITAIDNAAKNYYKPSTVNCATLEEETNYFVNQLSESEKKELSKKKGEEAEKTIFADAKKKPPINNSEVLWKLTLARINSNGQKIQETVAKNYTDLMNSCAGRVDADSSLSDEEKANIKNDMNETYSKNISALLARINKTFNAYSNNFNTDSKGDSCEGYLGDPQIKTTPAYYLQLALNVMKYLGIVFTLVMSAVDFTKATTSQDKDLLQKATKTSVKRLIYAILIFFLPVLINFILSLLGAYSTCVS